MLYSSMILVILYAYNCTLAITVYNYWQCLRFIYVIEENFELKSLFHSLYATQIFCFSATWSNHIQFFSCSMKVCAINQEIVACCGYFIISLVNSNFWLQPGLQAQFEKLVRTKGNRHLGTHPEWGHGAIAVPKRLLQPYPSLLIRRRLASARACYFQS